MGTAEESVMSSAAIKHLEDALRLPDRDRADLAARLIDRLDPPRWNGKRKQFVG